MASGRLYSWVFLASASQMPEGKHAEIESRFLEEKVRR